MPVVRCSRAARPGATCRVHTAELLRALADGVAVRRRADVAAEAVGGAASVRRTTCATPRTRCSPSPRPSRSPRPLLGPRSAARPRRLRTRCSAPPDRIAPIDDAPGRRRGSTRSRGTSTPTSPTRSRARRPGCGAALRAPRARRAPAVARSPAARPRVVLAAGLLWPTGAGGPATADAASSRARRRRSPPTSDAPATPPPTAIPRRPTRGDDPRQPADLAAVADGLLAARLACAGDESCLAERDRRSGGRRSPPARSTSPAAERTTTLLDDFGGVAVLRVDAVAGRRRTLSSS